MIDRIDEVDVMKKGDDNTVLFHRILNHLTMVRSAVEVVVEGKVGDVSEEAIGFLEEAQKRVRILVKEVEELREKVVGSK